VSSNFQSFDTEGYKYCVYVFVVELVAVEFTTQIFPSRRLYVLVFVVISSAVWWCVLQITVVLKIELAASQKSAQNCWLISYLLLTGVRIQQRTCFWHNFDLEEIGSYELGITWVCSDVGYTFIFRMVHISFIVTLHK